MTELFAKGPLDWTGLEIMSLEDCTAKLEASPIGRVAFLDAGEPVILPVNFAWFEHSVVFRTAHGGKLVAAMMQRPVCFEIDAWDGVNHAGWSVLVKGTAEEVLDAERIATFSHLKVRPWSNPELRSHWVAIRAGDISGRRVVLGPDDTASAPEDTPPPS